jgi:hypothetical protein
VWRFIQHLTLLDDLAQEPIAIIFFQALFHLVRGADVDIERERTFESQFDADGLVNGIPRRHDDQQIDVALLVRLAVGVRAEEDDLDRVKPFGNLTSETADRRERDVR